MKKAFFNWSGGKDSSLALYKVLMDPDFEVVKLVTTIGEEFNRISQHGVRTELLDLQARSIGISLKKIMLPTDVSMESYERIMSTFLKEAKEMEITHSVFGDIFLEDLRKYREEKLATIQIKACFPLWKQDTKTLALEFIEKGFKAIVVCIDGRKLDSSFVGRPYDLEFLKDLPEGIDPCGENGEFHTFVYEGPLFKTRIQYREGEKVYKSYLYEKRSNSSEYYCGSDNLNNAGFWFFDLIPV